MSPATDGKNSHSPSLKDGIRRIGTFPGPVIRHTTLETTTILRSGRSGDSRSTVREFDFDLSTEEVSLVVLGNGVCGALGFGKFLEENCASSSTDDSMYHSIGRDGGPAKPVVMAA